ncbi:MAG: ORF6N domain-containing protein [Proteobacteria bacterium]|nr:ORF6N domain-containing protein [Pseudomonadota bacterium]
MAKKHKNNDLEKFEPPANSPAIHVFRGENVILDQDVAKLFGVETKRLNEQVTRNAEKFQDDFAFRLNKEEFDDLRSQNATSSEEWGGTRYPPRVFTEHGVVMAATILKSPKAIQATRFVVQTFVQARRVEIGRKRNKNHGDSRQLSLPLEMRTALMTKVNDAIGHVLDAMINPQDGKRVRDEAQEVISEGIKGLKELLKKPGIGNDKTIAEIRKLMAEAESIEVATVGKKMENEERQLALLAKKLRLVLEAQHYAETGSPEGLMRLLTTLEQPSLPPPAKSGN